MEVDARLRPCVGIKLASFILSGGYSDGFAGIGKGSNSLPNKSGRNGRQRWPCSSGASSPYLHKETTDVAGLGNGRS